MSSVNIIQPAEPRPRAHDAARGRSGDPFADILASVAGPRRDRRDAAGGPERNPSPSGAKPIANARVEALERGQTPNGKRAESTRGADKAATQASNDLPAEAVEGDALAAPATEDGEAPPIDAPELPVETTDAEMPEANVEPDVAAHCAESRCPELSEQAHAAGEPANDIAAVEVNERVPAGAVVEAESDTAPEAEDEPAEPTPVEQVTDEPQQAAPAVTSPVLPDTASEVASVATRQAADSAKAVPPIQPGHAPKSPPGLEHAPGQQPVHPNPIAAAARESAPPFSDEGDWHRHPQHAKPQNPSHAEAAKAAAPGQNRTVEIAQASVPQLEALAPIQIDSNAAASLQAARPQSANLNPAMPQPAAGGADPVPLAANAVAVEIVSRMRDGLRRFDIRLDPPELGRIEVRLDVDRHGQVTTRLTVDRPETLELMQREARGLERALQQAGLKADEGSLQFSLRQHADGQGQEGGSERNMHPTVVEESDPAGSAVEAYRASILARGGVDIRI